MKIIKAFFKQFSKKEFNNIEKTSILFVDDCEDIILALNLLLKKQEYKIHTAINGKEALSILQENHIDIISVDFIMPGLDGIGLIEIIEKKIKDKKFILMITAYGEISMKKRVKSIIKNHTFTGFIIKPWRNENLVDIFNKYDKISKRRKIFKKYLNS
ncbi:response regulator [Bacteroidota bacterium]